MYKELVERVASAAEVGSKGRDANDTLNVSEIPLNWTVAAYETQCLVYWDVRLLEAMFSVKIALACTTARA